MPRIGPASGRLSAGVDETTPYHELLARARADVRVVGVVLMGSRAVGAHIRNDSDHDVIVVTSEPSAWQRPRGSAVDVWPMTLEQFTSHGLPGSPDAWNRPAFIGATVAFDSLEGRIESLVREKSVLGRDEARQIAREALDDYLNSLYRSLRNLEAGRELEGRLDAAESIGPLLTTLFALEGRVRPFNKWLRHEVEARPLRVDAVGLVERLDRDRSAATQRDVLPVVEAAARAAGMDDVVDGWEPDVAWLRGE